MLRMRQSVTDADAKALVAAALAAVELRGGMKAKSMAPDELFRLNVAMELVIDPPESCVLGLQGLASS